MEHVEYYYWSYTGANWTLLENASYYFLDEESLSEYALPLELTEISESALFGVVAYCIVFAVAVIGNYLAFRSLLRQYKAKKSRILLLLLHLSLADLIVCGIIIPSEIFWRLSVQWIGGDTLCKVVQVLRAFGLYLSSLILICLSIDRFMAIIFPMRVIGEVAYNKVKTMISLAWIAAVVFSIPQAFHFRIEGHPEFPSFKQCVTTSFSDNPRNMKIYSIFSLVVMYIFPLLVILFTYTVIFLKILSKSKSRAGSCNSYRYCSREPSVSPVPTPELSSENGHGLPNTPIQLRCSGNAETNLSKAKYRTLMMTIVIVLAFMICWTPYAVMTLWYIVDWEGAEQVDSRIQNVLFLMVVANSSINPLIYGGFRYNRGITREKRRCC